MFESGVPEQNILLQRLRLPLTLILWHI